MKKPERRVMVTLDEKTYKLLLAAAEEDYNTPEYELRIALRKGLEQITGLIIDED